MADAERLRALFDQAVDMPLAARRAFLDGACSGDAALRAVVEELLAEDARLEGQDQSTFLQSPLVAAVPSSSRQASTDEPVTPRPLPRAIGRYRIERLIGEGGMGTVYEAEEDEPRRTVALKVMRTGSDSLDLRKRFAREASILGRLNHVGIAQVYEAGGTEEGPLYFAMEFIRGLTLDEHVNRYAIDTRTRLELAARVCDAVQHAHEQGVVHRDLKPGNILVDDSGQPKVLDFGVAHATGGGVLGSTAHTRTGQLIGTLGYMSPEQVAADPRAVDSQSDVYALGVILFELLAGCLPYRLGDLPIHEVVRVIREEEPTLLGSVNRQFRGAVETIVAKALEKDKGRRYPSAGELAADLRRYLADQPIRARPASAWYKAQRLVTRHKGLVLGVAVVFAALVGATILSLMSAHHAHESARVARAEAYQARLSAAVNALTSHDVADAARHLKEAPEELRGWEWRHLLSRLDGRFGVIAAAPGEKLFLLKRPDGIQVARLTASSAIIADLEGKPIRTILFTSKRAQHRFAQQTGVGIQVIEGTDKNDLRLLDEAGTERLRLRVRHHGAVLSPDGASLAVFLEQDRRLGEVGLYDSATGERKATFVGDNEAIYALAFSPDGARIALAGEGGIVAIWHIASGTKVECRGHTDKILSIAFRADCARLVTASQDGTARQWETATGQKVGAPFDRHTGEVLSAAYSPNGEWIATGGGDRSIRLWRAADRQELAILDGHAAAVNELAFTPDGRRLISLSQNRGLDWTGDDTIGIWELGAASLPVLRGHSRYVYPVAYSPDGAWIASGSWDRTVCLWDALTGEKCAELPVPDVVRTLAFSPDGTWLAIGGDLDHKVLLFDTATGSLRKTIPWAGRDVQSLAISPDGTRIAAGRFHENDAVAALSVLEVSSDREVFRTSGAPLSYSPDGKWLAGTDATSKNVLLWDASDYRLKATWPGHTAAINSIVFHRDSKRLVSASNDHTVRVWDLAGNCLRVFEGHTDDVFSATFHPDGTRIASAGRDRSIMIWDPSSNQEGVRLPGHSSYVWSLAFSPDGKSLVSGSGDMTVRLWDTEPLRTRHLARREAEELRPAADRLVARLFNEAKDAAKVVAAIHSDPSLSEPQKKAALRAVLRRCALRE